MEWHVFNRLSIGGREKGIGQFNIFHCVTFKEGVDALLKEKDITYKEFDERLNTIAAYSFWGKYEYEIVATPFPTTISLEEFDNIKEEYNKTKSRYARESKFLYVTPEGYSKIDIYEQLQLNWGVFVKYVWEHREKE